MHFDRMRRWLVVLWVIFAGSAEANDKAKFQPTQIDPTLGLLQRQIAHYGSAAPIFGAGMRRGVDLSGTAALVEWTQPPSAEDLSKLEGLGIEIRA